MRGAARVLVLTPVRLLTRSVTWTPLLVALVVSAAVVVIRSGAPAAGPMQATALLLASAVGFALDDPASEVLAPSPTSLLRRRLRRVALVLAPAVSAWAVLLVGHGTEGRHETMMLGAQFAGLLGLAVAVAGVVTRRWDVRGGHVAGPAIFVAIILSTTFPPRWRPLPMGDVPGGWTAIVLRWSLSAVVGVLVLLISSRDPAARRPTLR